MATSAATYQTALELLAKKYHFPIEDAKKALAGKGLLPKKMLVEAKPKPADSPFASKAAAEYAAENSVEIKGLKGTSVKGKLTIKDLKSAAEPVGSKQSVSPAAAKYARDLGIDLSSIQKDGKILLADVKALEADSESDDCEPSFKLTTGAARLVEQYEIEDEDLEAIKGTGKGGTIKVGDLEKLIKEIKSYDSDSSDSAA